MLIWNLAKLYTSSFISTVATDKGSTFFSPRVSWLTVSVDSADFSGVALVDFLGVRLCGALGFIPN